MAADPPPSRAVRRDEALGRVGVVRGGRGTYVDEDTLRAMIDGDLTTDEDGVLIVTRSRKRLPRARARRAGAPAGPLPKAGAAASPRAHGGRHGAGRHGKPGGRPRRSRGDQGTWN